MSFRTLWNGVSLASIAVTLYTAYWVLAGVWGFPAHHIGPLSGDDDEVVVLGGSMHITSSEGFAADGSHGAQHVKGYRHVREILYGPNGGPFQTADIKSNKDIQIDLTYCDALPCQMTAGHYETVTLYADNKHENLKIKDPNGTADIGVEAAASPKDFYHLPDWKIANIAVKGMKAYDSSDGKCTVKLYYHCKKVGGNSTAECR